MFDHAPSADHSLLQDPAFAQALMLLGQSPRYLPNGQLVLSRRIMGLPLLMLPRAVPPSDLPAQLRAVKLHRRPLILSPDHPCAIPRALRLRAPQTRAVLDLSINIETRRAALHGKWRNALRRAEKSGLNIRRTPLPPDPDHPVLIEGDKQARARRYCNWPAALTAAFAATAPSQVQLFTATQAHKPLAYMLFLRHGAQASYHIGLTTDAGKACAAHNLLLWQATEWLANQGCHSLDLGLIDAKTPGLTRFKIRAGAALQQTGGTWLYWNPLARRSAA